jgi:hypothetical protein
MSATEDHLMDYAPFYKTRMGEEFYCRTVPDLIRQLERLNDILERITQQQDRDDDADA